MLEEIRLQKYLADNGIASRRMAEKFIIDGRVSVNGKVVTTLGTKIRENIDQVYFDGKKVEIKDDRVYILLNKPIGYVTTVRDQFNRDTVLDLVKVKQRIVPVGRLDMYTSGAIILTNDGKFVYTVTHPKHNIEKTYITTVHGNVTAEEVEQLKNGVEIDGRVTSKAKVKIIKIDEQKNTTRLEIIIHEGRNRQVRKMCDAINKKVIALHRTKIGSIDVKDLNLGTWRYLTKEEVNGLLKN